ncbi:MAG TPA: hypothetical protein VMW35_04655 [Myxococcota bacterium]|nr:hypothetical protein [Myxococcota bacterium]
MDLIARRGLPALLLIAALPLAAGCASVRRDVLTETPTLKVVLRSETKGGEPANGYYDHPAQISGVRLGHILSRIDVRQHEEDQQGRKPAFDADILFDVGDALSKALAKADKTQEVVVYATRQTRRLGIFNEDFLTTFIAFVQNDQLHVKLGKIDWLIPKDERNQPSNEPWRDQVDQKFRVLPSEAMTIVGPQELAVDWRDEIFRRPTAVQVTPTGKVVRRTILMESPEEAPAGGAASEGAAPTEELPHDLAPATLRKLADLEEQRQSGALSEAEYRTKRRDILAADPKAGEAPATPPGGPK